MVRRAIQQSTGKLLHLHFAAIRTDIGKGVENVSKFLGWQVLGVVVATVDCLLVIMLLAIVYIICKAAIQCRDKMTGENNTQFTK